MLSTSCEFHYDDITVTSFRNIECNDVAVEVARTLRLYAS